MNAMIFRASLLAVVVLWAIPILTRADPAEDAQRLFDSQYGERLATVKQTSSRSDDVDLANELFKVAKGSTENKPLVRVLCDNAAMLGQSDPTGFSVAIDALNLAREVDPNAHDVVARLLEVRRLQFKAADRQQKGQIGEHLITDLLDAIRIHVDAKQYDSAIDLYEEAYRTARFVKSNRLDAIRTGLAETRDAKRQADRINELESRGLKDPNDNGAVEQLLRIYVIELDDPKSAVRHAVRSPDAVWKINVPLATKAIEELSVEEAQSLADWYQGLADAVQAKHKLPMLKRAQQYLRRVLELHPAKGEARHKAEFALKGIEVRIAKLGGLKLDPAKGWIDLLALVDVKRDLRGDGKVVAGKGGSIEISERGATNDTVGRIEIPMAIKGEYIVKIRVTRLAGDGHFAIVLPISGRQWRCMLSAEYVGFTIVDRRVADPNHPAAKRLLNQMAIGKTHEIEIQVSPDRRDAKKAELRLDLDGKNLVRWNGRFGKDTDKVVWIGMQLPDTLGLYSYQHLRFESVHLKMINGKAVPLHK